MLKLHFLVKINSKHFMIATKEMMSSPSYDPRYVALMEDHTVHGMFHNVTYWIIDNKIGRVHYATLHKNEATTGEPYLRIDRTQKLKRKSKGELKRKMRKAMADL